MTHFTSMSAHRKKSRVMSLNHTIIKCRADVRGEKMRIVDERRTVDSADEIYRIRGSGAVYKQLGYSGTLPPEWKCKCPVDPERCGWIG